MRDHTRYIHRVYSDNGSREDFDFVGQVWDDLNPTWRVQNWTVMDVVADNPLMAPLVKGLADHPDRLEVLLGMALVVRWGGLYAGSHLEPTKPLPVSMPGSPWMLDEHLFGADEPDDLYWADLLTECIRPYIQALTDTNLTTLFRRHSTGQLRYMPGMQSVIA
jgi:hypothetical protein